MAKKKGVKPAPAAGPPVKKTNTKAGRGREYLTEDEVSQLRREAGNMGRHGVRDQTMILVAYRHGLRVSELIAWQWDQIDMDAATVYVRRKKGSKSGMHTLQRDEIALLKRIGHNPRDRTGNVFRNERGGPMSESSFFKIIARAGKEAGLPFPVHPHMLRHACGFELTKAGHPTRVIQDWLGHRNIQHTVRYTELDPGRFKSASIWGEKKKAATFDE